MIARSRIPRRAMDTDHSPATRTNRGTERENERVIGSERGDVAGDGVLPGRHRDAEGGEFRVRQHAVHWSLGAEFRVGHADRDECRLDTELTRELAREIEPGA